MSTNYYTASTASQNVPLSVAFWINTDLRYDMTVFSLCGPSYGIGKNAAIQVDIATDGRVVAYLAMSSNNWWTVILASAPIVHANVWCHLALTVSATYNAKLYINGELISSQTGTGPFPSSLITNMAFGTSGDLGQRGYNGYMSGFGLYYMALSVTQVNLLFTFGGKLQDSNFSSAIMMKYFLQFIDQVYIHDFCFSLIATYLNLLPYLSCLVMLFLYGSN